MKITCMIVDDEALARRLLTDYVSRLPVLQLVAVCSSAVEARVVLQKQKVDLLFLDIHMPDISGISFLHMLGRKQLTVFTTAYSEYALKGYELAIMDYLVKPISFERFFQTVNRAMDYVNHIPETDDFIFVKSDSKIHKIKFEDIDYVEAYGEYIRIHCGKDRIMPLLQLGKIEEMLPTPQFMRVHRSYIIQFSKIDTIQGNTVLIENKEIPVSKTYRDALMERVNRKNLF